MSETFYVEKDKFVSDYLIQKFKLWVWDFDDTLIDTATYYRKSMEPEDILRRTNKELDVEVPNWRYFKRLVNYLITRGIRVAIASFGTYKIIRAYMDRIFGLNQKIFTDVNLKALCRDITGKPTEFYPNKNTFIERIMEHYRIYEPIKIVLFDDNMTNISDAMVAGLVGVKIVGKTGMHNECSSLSANTDDTYFGENIIIKLEKTLKRLEKEAKLKENCPPNNLKNETFSSIGSRKVGLKNEKYRRNREEFLESIKKKICEDRKKEEKTDKKKNKTVKETFSNKELFEETNINQLQQDIVVINDHDENKTTKYINNNFNRSKPCFKLGKNVSLLLVLLISLFLISIIYKN